MGMDKLRGDIYWLINDCILNKNLFFYDTVCHLFRYKYNVGGKINIIQYGAGQTRVITTGAAVLLSSGGADKITNQYGAATIIKRSSTEFYLFGEITT
jgi:hypothetical protein